MTKKSFGIIVKEVRFQQSWLGVCLLDKIFLVAITDNLQEKGNEYRITSTTNLTRGGMQTNTLDLICSPSSPLVDWPQSKIVSFVAVNILLSITTFLENLLILVALHKESSLHRPSKLLYCSLATTDLLVDLVCQPLQATYMISLVHEHWGLCQYAYAAVNITGIALCGVSLLTMAAISGDRLLALLLGLRYKQVVTLKRTYIIVATFWVFSLFAASPTIFVSNTLYMYLFTGIGIPLCLTISLASYTKIFYTLRYHQTQVHDHVQQQPNQPNALVMARFRRAVYNALWVQFALVVCYAPFCMVSMVIAFSKTYSLHFIVLRTLTFVLVYFNLTLNPFLYCWKIREVRQAVLQTFRQALCCPRS